MFVYVIVFTQYSVNIAVSDTHLDLYKRQHNALYAFISCIPIFFPVWKSYFKFSQHSPFLGSPEKSFSTLKRLKNYLSNTRLIRTDWLVGLLSVHHNISVGIDSVVERFFKVSSREAQIHDSLVNITVTHRSKVQNAVRHIRLICPDCITLHVRSLISWRTLPHYQIHIIKYNYHLYFL